MAQSGHVGRQQSRQLSGVKRTPQPDRVAATYNPKRTLALSYSIISDAAAMITHRLVDAHLRGRLKNSPEFRLVSMA